MPVELPLPQPSAGEVLIRVAYVGVNRADVMQLAGQYAPPEGASPLLGLEVSGWVAALGAGVNGFFLGQEVCALLAGGGYAEYVAAPAAQVLPLPAGLGLREAACLPEAAATSMMALHLDGQLQTGERVLIHGGASGLGILMVQIATSMGAQVLATVGSAEKASFLEGFGIHALNHRTAPFAAQVMEATQREGVDVIIDTLGAPQFVNHLRLLRPRGRLVSLAMLEGSRFAADASMTRLLLNQLRWSGATLRNRSPTEKAEIMRLVGKEVWPALANGTIQPVIDGIFPLSEAKKALARMQERLHIGKILLEVTPK